jgi:hypothetical protein
MGTIRKVYKIGTFLSVMVFVLGCLNAWAVVPYPLPPDLVKAETVQAEKREIIKRIENLKKLDDNAINEIRNDLKQMEAKDNNSLSQDVARGKGIKMFGFILFIIVVVGLSALLYGKRE